MIVTSVSLGDSAGPLAIRSDGPARKVDGGQSATKAWLTAYWESRGRSDDLSKSSLARGARSLSLPDLVAQVIQIMLDVQSLA